MKTESQSLLNLLQRPGMYVGNVEFVYTAITNFIIGYHEGCRISGESGIITDEYIHWLDKKLGIEEPYRNPFERILINCDKNQTAALEQLHQFTLEFSQES